MNCQTVRERITAPNCESPTVKKWFAANRRKADRLRNIRRPRSLEQTESMYSCNSKGEKTDGEGSKCTKCNKERAKVLFSCLTKKRLGIRPLWRNIHPFCKSDIIQHLPLKLRRRLIKLGYKTNQKSTHREGRRRRCTANVALITENVNNL